MATYRTSKRKIWVKRSVIFSLLLIFAIAVALVGSYIFVEYFQPAPASARPEKNTSGVVVSTIPVETKQYETVTKEKEDMYKGPLILVNNKNLCQFKEEGDLVGVLEQKQGNYKVSDRNVKVNRAVMKPLDAMLGAFRQATGFGDLLVASGYRSKELQESLFQREVEQKGEEEAALWVAKPGGSEHHSGYGIDFSIYTDLGISMEYAGTGKCAWINQNCYQYGFVVRFPEDKEEITGIDYEPWHFRYVGIPHAYIMNQHGFCLEEYIEFLKDYPFDKPHLNVTDDAGQKYEIYYVKGQGERTEIQVPKQTEYSISGNNQDGFIVTAKRA
ncbi:MAG: M15 family metallopeptidase [Clostridiales bacterium]|jgi:D-alanyl-D-alanine carboxypeptidase|nr:M15 family metallopeptidase [Clostridiales bacterium]